VLRNSNPDSLCLIIVNQRIYNCTAWQSTHPGGHLTIRALCGKDATANLLANHDDRILEKWLPRFYYGEVKESPWNNEKLLEEEDNKCSRATAEEIKAVLAFQQLSLTLRESGMFQTSYYFYYVMFAWLALLFSLVLAGVFCSDLLWVHSLAGLTLGLFWQQVAFLGHDLGHNGVTHDRIKDSLLGIFFGNFCSGIGVGWWKRSHNVHHIVTNSIDFDPDIQHMPIFAITPAFLKKPIFSTFYNKFLDPPNWFAHLMIRYQHWLYYPVMAFARFNLYAQGIMHSVGIGPYSIQEVVFRRDLQILALIGFWIWLIALTLQLPTWTSRAVFFLLAHNVAGILHVQITLSHFAMASYHGVTYDNASNGYLFTQLNGSMDIDCPPWLDWFHGGLQFQAVHHLWPSVPRHNLRNLQKVLISFCQEHKLPYHHVGFFAANRMVLKALRSTSMTTKTLREMYNDALNLRG